MIAAWLIASAALLAGSRHLGPTNSGNVNLTGTQANTGATLLKASDPSNSGYSGLVVAKSGSGTLAGPQRPGRQLDRGARQAAARPTAEPTRARS